MSANTTVIVQRTPAGTFSSTGVITLPNAFQAGVQGTQGTTGTQGLSGEASAQGIQGTTGAGTQGTTGSTGVQGTTGLQAHRVEHAVWFLQRRVACKL